MTIANVPPHYTNSNTRQSSSIVSLAQMAADKYRIVEPLSAAPGLMGRSFYAAEKSEKGSEERHRVLKVIEARDHSEGQLITKQLAELQALKHPYIVLPTDVYSTFDTKISAAYVRVVRPFYPKGALDVFLREKRDAGESVHELQVQKWIGQIVDVLRFLQQKSALHRNLKPANLLLGANSDASEQDELLLVCDFGVAAVMADCRTKTRRNAEAYYSAPESARHPFDERCDCWSLGACLLDVCSCSLLSETEVQDLLMEAKRTSQAISSLLDQLSETYSADLLALIGGLLRVDPGKRLTVQDLLENPYVQSCLQLTDSAIVHRRIRQSVSINDRPLPLVDDFNGQIKALVAYIDNEIENELCVMEALKALSQLQLHQVVSKHISRPKSRLSDADHQNNRFTFDMIKALCKAIEHNRISEEVCAYGMQAITPLIKRLPVKSMPQLQVVVDLIVHCFQEHTRSVDVYSAGGHLTSLICVNESNANTLGNSNVVRLLCEMLQYVVESGRADHTEESTHKHIGFCCNVCNGLWSLSTVGLNVMTAQHSGIFKILLTLIKQHMDRPDVLTCATSLLLAITNEDLSPIQVFDEDAIFTLISIGERHSQHAKLLRNAILTLASLSRLTDEAAFAVIECEKIDKSEILTGVNLISKAFDNHRDNLEVVEAVCDLVEALMSHDEMLEFIPSKWELIDTIRSFWNRFQNHKRIAHVCSTAITKLEHMIEDKH